MRKLAIIGEASRQVPSHIKDQYPLVPWRKINSLRNKLIHEYFEVDIEIVWNVCQNDLPELKATLAEILKR